MTSNIKKSKENKIDKLQKEAIRLGGPLAGNVSGPVIGALLGGPIGAAIGGAAVTVLTEFASRALGVREKERVNALFLLAAQKIDEKIAEGKKIRGDNFFVQGGNRSAGEEIFEGIVLASQREYEEKKLLYYANLLANIAFSNIEKSDVNLLLKVAEQLSYRQLCLIELFAGHQIKSALRCDSYRGTTGNEVRLSNTLIAILQEIYELNQNGLVNCSGEALLGMTDITPTKMNVQGMGNVLGGLMELSLIPVEDIAKVASYLR